MDNVLAVKFVLISVSKLYLHEQQAGDGCVGFADLEPNDAKQTAGVGLSFGTPLQDTNHTS